VKEEIKKDYEKILKTLIQKGMFHIYQTSFSIRTQNDKFLINKNDALFLEEDIFTEIHYKKDLSWQEASNDANIHSFIYQKISTAKCIAHIFPINLVTYSLYHRQFKALDFYGENIIGKKKIHEITDTNHFIEEVENIVQKNIINDEIVIIKGYGAYIYDRDLKELAKKASILENSAKILLKIKNI
jgi:L-fuculose-phosphate aldolase